MNFRLSTILPGSTLADLTLLTLIDVAAKGFVLFTVASFVALVLRRTSAANRHIVWISALTCALLLPFGAWLLPQWRVLPGWMKWDEVPQRLVTPASVAARVDLPVQPIQTEAPPVTLPAMEFPAAPLAFSEPAPPPVTSQVRIESHLLLLVWMAGAALLLGPLFYSVLALRRIAAQARRIEDGPLAAMMEEIQREIGCRRRIRLFAGRENAMPMVWGIFRPCLLLPSSAATWTPSRMRGVLLHELAHLRRHDPLSLLVAQLALALHWFNPLAWLAVRQLRAEQERACDDNVLRYGMRASEYAGDLLAVAARLQGASGALVALSMAHPCQAGGSYRPGP